MIDPNVQAVPINTTTAAIVRRDDKHPSLTLVMVATPGIHVGGRAAIEQLFIACRAALEAPVPSP